MGKGFVKGAVVLTVATLISKIIGALYRIPLTNILGAEGVGLYQLIFSVYAVLVTLLASGLPISISRLTAERISQGKSGRSVLKSGLILGVGGGVLMASLLAIFSGIIANIQGNPVVKNGYYCIAPALVFVGGITVFKGYFQGTINMVPTSLSYLTEQVFKLGIGLGFAIWFAPKGLIYSVYGAILGVTLSEVVSFLILFFMYLYKVKDTKYIKEFKTKDDIKVIMSLALPVTMGAILIPISQFVDSFMVVNLLSKYISVESATTQYGLFSGAINPILNMPIVLVLSLAVVIVPVVSKNRIKHDYSGILLKSKLAIKFALFLGIPCALIFIVYSKEILMLFYPKFSPEEVAIGSMLFKISAFSIVFFAIMQIETALMQALDRIYVPIRNLFIGIVIKIILTAVLIQRIGINGLAIATLTLSFVALALNSISYHRLLGFNFNLSRSLIVSVVSSAIFLGIIYVTKIYVSNYIVSFFVATIVGGVIYFILMMILKFFEDDELNSFSFGKKILKFIERHFRKE